MQTPAIIRVLEDAKTAHEAGDFVNALKFYEQFFDHALDDDPYALYGVRLNHCLAGWGRLAGEFVGAKNRLEAKQQEVLSKYKQRKLPESFHDYYAISEQLGKKVDAIEQFLIVLESNQKSAARIVKYVWQDLIDAEHWGACNQFLEEPVQKVDESFAMFDEQIRLRSMNEQFATDKFEQYILDQLISSVDSLILILRHNGRSEDVDVVQRKFFEIAHQKNHVGLNHIIQTKGSFLFGGH